MDQPKPTTEVLYTDCPDGKVCPAVIRVSGLEGQTALVGKIAADPAVAEALAAHVGPGETVLLVPDSLIDWIRKGTP